MFHDRLNRPLDMDMYIARDDPDRKGIETCIEGFSRNECLTCSLNIIVLDAFFDYFAENLASKGIPKDVIGSYMHVHNAQLSIHCCYNESYLFPEVPKK